MVSYIYSGMEDPNNPDEIIHSDLVQLVSCEAGAAAMYGSPEFHVRTVSDLSDVGVYFCKLLIRQSAADGFTEGFVEDISDDFFDTIQHTLSCGAQGEGPPDDMISEAMLGVRVRMLALTVA
jgi:hypothetical protein